MSDSPPSQTLTPDVPEETRIGGSPAGWAANAALLALSKAARSLRIYKAGNEAVRRLVAQYQEMMQIFLGVHGALSLDVRPFELVLDGEVVYLERDRERSLAYRLFQDGVRSLRVDSEATWDELSRLLELMSMRFMGTATGEDDFVTLLHKASLASVQVVAVIGTVLDEDEASESGGLETGRVDVPWDWDLGGPPSLTATELAWRPVGETWLSSLQAEASPGCMPADTLHAALEILAAVESAADPTTLEDVESFVDEALGLLVGQRELELLLRLVQALRTLYASHHDPVRRLLTSLTRDDRLQGLLRAVPVGDLDAVGTLRRVLDEVPGVHINALVGHLMNSDQGDLRWAICEYVAQSDPQEARRVMNRVHRVNPDATRDLLDALSRALEDRGLAAALEVVGHPDEQVQHVVLRILQEAEYSNRVGRALTRLLESPDKTVRIRSADLLAEQAESRAFAPLVDLMQIRAPRDLEADEAEAMGQALAALDPTNAYSTFAAWIRPKSLLKRFTTSSGSKMLQWTAVSGLELAPDDEAADLIEWAAKRAGEDLHRHCMATLARRRRRQAPHG